LCADGNPARPHYRRGAYNSHGRNPRPLLNIPQHVVKIRSRSPDASCCSRPIHGTTAFRIGRGVCRVAPIIWRRGAGSCSVFPLNPIGGGTAFLPCGLAKSQMIAHHSSSHSSPDGCLGPTEDRRADSRRSPHRPRRHPIRRAYLVFPHRERARDRHPMLRASLLPREGSELGEPIVKLPAGTVIIADIRDPRFGSGFCSVGSSFVRWLCRRLRNGRVGSMLSSGPRSGPPRLLRRSEARRIMSTAPGHSAIWPARTVQRNGSTRGREPFISLVGFSAFGV
jgi:hypothetical protein